MIQVDDILETKLDRKFQLVLDKGTLDAIGLHPDGTVKRYEQDFLIFFVVVCHTSYAIKIVPDLYHDLTCNELQEQA